MSTFAALRPDQPLTAREREVVEAIAASSGNVAAGVALGVATSTVKQHLRRIAIKAGISDRAGIVGWSVRTGQLAIPVSGVKPLGFEERHFDVLVRIARGRSNEQIAAELGLPVETVKSRVRKLFVLLEVDCREAAVAAGFAYGVLRLVPRQRVAA